MCVCVCVRVSVCLCLCVCVCVCVSFLFFYFTGCVLFGAGPRASPHSLKKSLPGLCACERRFPAKEKRHPKHSNVFSRAFLPGRTDRPAFQPPARPSWLYGHCIFCDRRWQVGSYSTPPLFPHRTLTLERPPARRRMRRDLSTWGGGQSVCARQCVLEEAPSCVVSCGFLLWLRPALSIAFSPTRCSRVLGCFEAPATRLMPPTNDSSE